MWLSTLLSIIVSTLSIVMLVRRGFLVGNVEAPLQLVLDWYEAFMRFLFAWAEPYLKNFLANVRSWIDWDLNLYPHWKHVIVLMGLYFGAETKHHWSSGTKGFAAILALWGGVVAVAAGVAAGTVPLGDATSNMLMVAFPVAGGVVYEFGHSAFATMMFRHEGLRWWQAFRTRDPEAYYIASVGAIVLLLGTQADKVPFIKTLPNPGLAFLAGLVVALALYYIGKGARFATKFRRQGDGWWRAFRRSGSTRVGLLMLQAIVGATAFFLANAGLKLVPGL